MENLLVVVGWFACVVLIGQLLRLLSWGVTRAYAKMPVLGSNPGMELLRWESAESLKGRAKELFRSEFSSRGFEVGEMPSTRLEASRGDQSWRFGGSHESSDTFEVTLHVKRGRRVADCVASYDESRDFDAQLEVGVRTWSRAVQFHGVLGQYIGEDAEASMRRVGVADFLVDSIELKATFRLDPKSIVRHELDYVGGLMEVRDVLDEMVLADEDAWFEALAPVFGVAEASKAVDYFEERLRRGHMTRVEAAARYLERRPERRRLLGRVLEGVDPRALVSEVGEDEILRAYCEMAEASGRLTEHLAEELLVFGGVLVRAMGPARLFAGGRSVEADGWSVSACVAGGVEVSELDAVLSGLWRERGVTWRERVCQALSRHGEVSFPGVLEVAASEGMTDREHHALSGLVRASSEEALEVEGVARAIVDQIERAPVGSYGALTKALVGVRAERIRGVLMARARDADPLSTLRDAARELLDPERLGGALMEVSSGGGELTVASARGGALSEAAVLDEDGGA